MDMEEVHYGGEGPHWTVVPMKKKKNADREEAMIYTFVFLSSQQHQIFTYADDVNLIGDDIRTIERNADVSLNACKDIGLAVDIGKTKYMEVGRHQGMIANEHIRLGSIFYTKVITFKYLVSLVTN